MNSCVNCGADVDDDALNCPECGFDHMPVRKEVKRWFLFVTGGAIVVGAAAAITFGLAYDPGEIQWIDAVTRQRVDPRTRWWCGLAAIVMLCAVAGAMFGIVIDWARQRNSDRQWRAKRRAYKPLKELSDEESSDSD